MGVIEAMQRVLGHLLQGDTIAAQQAVLSIEARRSVLPSSIFEKVFRAAVKAGELQPAYAQFCLSMYGRQQYSALVRAELPR